MKVMYVLVIFFTIHLNGMDQHKQAKKESPSLINRIACVLHLSSKPKQDWLDLGFYKEFKKFPDEIKLLIWQQYNKAEDQIHDEQASKFVVPFDQNFSDEFIEKHVVRYKDPDYWDSMGKHYDYPVRVNRTFDENINLRFMRENNSPIKDKYPIHSAYGVGPNSQSNIKIEYGLNRYNLITLDDQHIWLKSDENLKLKKKVYCVHPEKNQILVGLPVSILNVVNAGSTRENITTELNEIPLPPGLQAASIRFGPKSSLFIKKEHEDAIIHYDYAKKELLNSADVKQLFNDYVQQNPLLHKQIYDSVSESMHRKYRDSTAKCLASYASSIPYLIEIADFVYPTTASDYLLIKFNVKLPYCDCCRKPVHENGFTYPFEDYFALYNVKNRNFMYIGNKHYTSRPDGSYSLPSFKSMKSSALYTYVYDFISHQSDGQFHTFCYDDELNTHDNSNHFPSRKMVAIVPDDDIARLEQMMLVTIAKKWCQKKTVDNDGFEILKHLIEASSLLQQEKNPFKQKRVALLKIATEQLAKKLKIDLQNYIKHLNQQTSLV